MRKTVKNSFPEDGTLWDAGPRKRQPLRTCAGCGRKSHKSDFLRFVLSPEGKAVLDFRQKMQARGIYLCPQKACVAKGLKRKAFSRFLKKDGLEPPLEALAKDTLFAVESYVFSLTEMARKAGKIAVGSSAVWDSCKKGKAALLLIACDAGRSVKEKTEFISGETGIKIVEIPDKEIVARKLDIAEAAVLAVTDDGFARALEKGWDIRNDVKFWY